VSELETSNLVTRLLNYATHKESCPCSLFANRHDRTACNCGFFAIRDEVRSGDETSVHAAFDSMKEDRDKAYAALGWCTGCDVPLPRCRSGGAGKKCCPDCSHPTEWTCGYVGPGGRCGKENDALRTTCWYCHHPRNAVKATVECRQCGRRLPDNGLPPFCDSACMDLWQGLNGRP
jgi:hypothetical protein